jgi:hypothetical protein
VSYSSYSTLTGSSYGITLSPSTGEKAPKTPAGLVVTQAVQTKDGWLGQVIVDKEIVWERTVGGVGEDAIQAANERVVAAFRTLFAAPPEAPDVAESA